MCQLAIVDGFESCYILTYIHIAEVTSCGTWKSPQDENVSTSSWSASRLCTWKRTYLWTNLSFHLSMVFPFCTLKSKCSKNWNHIILFVFLIFPTWPTPTAGWHNSALPAYFRSMPRSEDTWLTWLIIAHRSEGDDKYPWLDKTPSSLVPVLLLAPNPLLGVLEPRRLLLQPLDWERAETF